MKAISSLNFTPMFNWPQSPVTSTSRVSFSILTNTTYLSSESIVSHLRYFDTFQTCYFAIECSNLLLKLFPKILSHYSHIAYGIKIHLFEIIHSWFDVLPTFLSSSFATPPQSFWVTHDSLNTPCILVSLPLQVLLPLQGMLLLLFCYLNTIPYSSSLRIMSYPLWNFPESHICSFYLFHCANIMLCIYSILLFPLPCLSLPLRCEFIE